MRTLIVDEKNNNKKLNTVLLNEYNFLKLNTLYKALRKKDIRVNDKRVSDNIVVHTGDKITVFIADEFLFENSEIGSFTPNIVYSDDNILIVNKSTGIEVTGSNSLTSALSVSLGFPVFPCHRLDRNTSGLTLFAKNEESLNILLDKFKEHEIEKHYSCVVYGVPARNSDILTAYLFKDNKKSIVYISDTPKISYQKIITEYKIISTNKQKNTSVLDVTLHTGRTHQIRAHLAHIGYPIIGDGKYGKNEINKQFNAKVQQLCSTSLKFNFSSNAGILNYLKGKQIVIPSNF